MSEEVPRVLNQETDPRYNAEGGIAVVPGSAAQKEYAKFEQFPHSKWAFGNPGNPYVKREFPKMVYRAERRNGKIMCMETEPDVYEYKDDRAYRFARESAERFTRECQRIVNDEVELSHAFEDGFRLSPKEAIEHAHKREDQYSQEIAHRNHDDRNLSEKAKAEIKEVTALVGEPVPEVPEKPKARRGRPPKVA